MGIDKIFDNKIEKFNMLNVIGYSVNERVNFILLLNLKFCLTDFNYLYNFEYKTKTSQIKFYIKL